MIVIDASVVVDLLLDAPGVAPLPESEVWVGPAHLDVEVVSALRRLLLRGRLTEVQVRSALGTYADLGILTWPVDAGLRSRMVDLADNLTAYDAGYAALAEAMDATLVTRDAGLAAAAPESVITLLV